MRIQLHPENPDSRKIKQLVEVLENDGVIIIPTDSVYALACHMNSQKAVDRICKLRGLDPVKANLTFMCDSVATLAAYAAPISNQSFRLIKRNIPGPFTFILKSNNEVPKLFKNKKRTIGARIPDHVFIQDLVSALGSPLMTSSLKLDDDEFHESDVDEIDELWGKRVDAIVESGIVPNVETAIVDLSGGDIEVIREGNLDLQY